MQNDKEGKEDFTNTIKKKQDKVIEQVSKNYEQTLETGKEIGKESLDKINEATSASVDFIKSRPYWKSIKENSLKLKEKSRDSSTSLKKKSPKFYKKISKAFFYFFQTLIGRIKLGTQYGVDSLEILERLAKLKELGILTDEEFTRKKKEILDRI